MYTPSKCFDNKSLENGTVLRTDPSSMATMKRGKIGTIDRQRNNISICGILQQLRKSAEARQLYLKSNLSKILTITLPSEYCMHTT